MLHTYILKNIQLGLLRYQIRSINKFKSATDLTLQVMPDSYEPLYYWFTKLITTMAMRNISSLQMQEIYAQPNSWISE